MTTIAVRDGIMCSDSQATRGDFIDNRSSTKIYEVSGCLVGISGNAISSRKFVEWFQDMAEHSAAQDAFPLATIQLPDKMVEEDFHALVAYPDKTVYEFFGCDNIIECEEDYAAVGSGMLYALCAMDAGASAEEAVKVAIKRDVYSGGEIQKHSLEEEEELTEDDIRAMSHEDLLKLVLGEDESEDEDPNPVQEVADKVIGRIEKSHQMFGDFIFEDGICKIGDYSWNVEYCNDGELKNLASTLHISFAHNIGIEKLRQRILDFLKEED
jgi:ATP-dependent protease HslVU (ClpYQ) peptidase subunit